jgi:hypothetical protein
VLMKRQDHFHHGLGAGAVKMHLGLPLSGKNAQKKKEGHEESAIVSVCFHLSS